MPGAGRLIAALVAALVLAACASAAKPKAPPPDAKFPVEAYFPLNAGRRWSYRVQDFRKGWTYRNNVKVYGVRRYGDREGIEVEERYTGGGTFWVLEEQEPVLYYRDQGFLHRLFLTRQGGKLVPASGSGDTRFLPAILEAGASWDSATVAFQVQAGETGFEVKHRHLLVVDPAVIRVPAGSFSNCIRVDTYSSHGPGSGAHGDEIAFYYSDWYAPGVGLVRTQQWDDEKRTKERSRIELLEYSTEEGGSAGGG